MTKWFEEDMKCVEWYRHGLISSQVEGVLCAMREMVDDINTIDLKK